MTGQRTPGAISETKRFVQTFLASVAQPRDAELYLRLFQQLPRRRFAVVAAEPEVFERALPFVLEPVRLLAELELLPTLALNLLPAPTDRLVREAQSTRTPLQPVRDALVRAGVATAALSAIDFNAEQLARSIGESLDAGQLPVVDFAQDPNAQTMLSTLLSKLQTQKLALLRSTGGIGPKAPGLLRLTDSHQLLVSDQGISVVNLRTDRDALTRGEVLPQYDRQLLDWLGPVHAAHPRLTTSVTSPLNLLSELFSVKGAGTLVKAGSFIQRVDSYDQLNQPALHALLERTFQRSLSQDFWAQGPRHVYFEVDYRGAAIVLPGPQPTPPKPEAQKAAAFLTKFAVDRAAQGEGIGRDIWETVVRDHPALYWRSRVNNPIASWYAKQCHGMQTVDNWRVYWRGVSTEDITTVVEDTLRRPSDFPEDAPGAEP